MNTADLEALSTMADEGKLKPVISTSSISFAVHTHISSISKT